MLKLNKFGSLFIIGLCCTSFALQGCGNKKEVVALNVSAASSLTESLTEISDGFTKKTGVPVNLNFGASSTLKTQILSGFDVDLFLSANFSHYDDLNGKGYIEKGEKFVSNVLCLATSTETGVVNSMEDMKKEGVKVIFANESVPVGKYTYQILTNMDNEFGGDFKAKVNKNVVSKEENVRQVLSKVVLGEGDCAIVYKTDITGSSADKLKIIEIPQEFNVRGEYYMGILKKEKINSSSKDFYEYIQSDESTQVFKKYGFDTH